MNLREPYLYSFNKRPGDLMENACTENGTASMGGDPGKFL